VKPPADTDSAGGFIFVREKVIVCACPGRQGTHATAVAMVERDSVSRRWPGGAGDVKWAPKVRV